MKTTKQTIEGFDKEFLKDMGDECEPVFIDPVGCVGPIRYFIARALEYQEKLKQEMIEKILEMRDLPLPYPADKENPMKHIYQNEGYAKALEDILSTE